MLFPFHCRRRSFLPAAVTASSNVVFRDDVSEINASQDGTDDGEYSSIDMDEAIYVDYEGNVTQVTTGAPPENLQEGGTFMIQEISDDEDDIYSKKSEQDQSFLCPITSCAFSFSKDDKSMVTSHFNSCHPNVESNGVKLISLE